MWTKSRKFWFGDDEVIPNLGEVYMVYVMLVKQLYRFYIEFIGF